MDLITLLPYSLIGACGATIVETFNIVNTVATRPEVTVRRLLRSTFFWFITILVLTLSGLAAWIINYQSIAPSVLQILISGIGARSLIRLAAFSLVPRPASGHQDPSADSRVSFHDLVR